MTTTTRCQCRRQAITNLRCARCNVPVCPACSQNYSAGTLCRTCAKGTRTRLEIVEGGDLAKGVVATLGTALFLGWLMATMRDAGLMLVIWGGLLHGVIVSEVALRATGRKRGLTMEVLAGGSCLVGVIAGWYIEAIKTGVPVGAGEWGDPWSYVLMGFSALVAVSRIRSL